MSELLHYLCSTRDAFKDSRRLNSLYGDFATHEHSNPEGYRANVDEWRNALIAAAREGIIPAAAGSKEIEGSRFVVQTGDHLLQALETRQYGIPVGLGKVVEDAVKRRAFLEVKEFKSAEHSIYQRSWIPPIPSVSNVLIWTWKQVGFGGNSRQSLPKGQWIIPENLEAASVMLLKHIATLSHSSTVSDIHTLSSISTYLPVELSNNDLSLLLTYLTRDKPQLSHKLLPDGTTIVKLGTSPITETDITISNLKSLHAHLSQQIPVLEASITDLTAQARSAVSSKNTVAARAALRRKKLTTDALEKRHDQAFSIQQTLDKIDQAADNVAMVRAMESSAGVLRRLNAEVGGVEGAEKVSDRLAEEMSAVNEVSAVLNEPGVGQVIDDAEVDEEYEAMMKQEEDKLEHVRKEKEAEETRQKMSELAEFERREKERAAAVATPATKSQPVEQDVDVAKTAEKIAEMSL